MTDNLKVSAVKQVESQVTLGGHCLFCLSKPEVVFKFNQKELEVLLFGYLLAKSQEWDDGLLEELRTLSSPPLCEKCFDNLKELRRLDGELKGIHRKIQRNVKGICRIVKETKEGSERKSRRDVFIEEETKLALKDVVLKMHDRIISRERMPLTFTPMSQEDECLIEEDSNVTDPLDILGMELAPLTEHTGEDTTTDHNTFRELDGEPPSKKTKVQVEFITIEEYTDNTSQVFVTPLMTTSGEDQVVELPVNQQQESSDQVLNEEVMKNQTPQNLIATEQESGGQAGNGVNLGGVSVDPSANYVMIHSNVTDPTTGTVSVQPILISVSQLQTMQQQPQVPADSITIDPPLVVVTSKKRSTIKGAYSTPSEYVYFNEDLQPCDVCNARIPRGSEVASHLATHVGSDYVFYCSDCQLGFISPFRLERYHLSKTIRCRLDTIGSSARPIYSCDQCNFQVDKVLAFKKHLDTHESTEGLQKSFQCPLCPLRFTGKRRLEVHLDEKHVFTKPSGRQKCDICGSFFDLGEIESHLWTHGVTEILRCKLCMCLFSSVDSIIEHQTAVKRRGIHDISCHVCAARFIRARDLRLHYFEEHSIGNKFQCDKCQEELFSANSFQDHLQKCQVEDEMEGFMEEPSKSTSKKVRKLCPECTKSFSSTDILLRHRIKEHSHPPVSCDRANCSLTFTSEQEKRYHVAQDHQGFTVIKNPYTCDQCGEQFPKRDKLRKHKFVKHSDVKPYACEVCALTYRNKKTLADHVKLKHFGEKKAKTKICDVCQKGFADGQVLKQHKLIHTNERPYVCGVCEQRFRQRTAWRTHEKSHEKLGDAFKPKGEMERKGEKGNVAAAND